VNAGTVLLWVVLPYVSVTIFLTGHIWRYRHDQFGWTSRSTKLLEGRLLAVGSPLFHYGALAAIGGHVLGILVPSSVTTALGVNEHAYHLIASVAGSVAGVVCVIGFLILVYRRITVRRVAVTTSWLDLAAFGLLTVLIGLGVGETLAVQVFGHTYDYRASISPWFRSLLILQPKVGTVTDAPLIFQIHAISAWLLFALWPFTRLVHAWSIPVQSLGRPYILYRRRYSSVR
jgi:respiratory nitrate reductase gamma subunit